MNTHHEASTRAELLPAGACDRSGPLFADTGLKLALFGINCCSAGALSTSEDRHEIDWDQNVELVLAAERAGWEAVIPISRWRGFEGATNPWGQSFETYTWAAGLAAVTSRVSIFSTSHSLTVSPVMAAKQLATVDHISKGRAALNVVAGWFEKELRMFGAHALDHDERYGYAEEWLATVQKLWTERDAFDHRGTFFDIEGAYLQPKPVQSPRPPVMNAAFSPRGHQCAAKLADLAFVGAMDVPSAGKQAARVREMAAGFGRTVQVWVAASVICAPTAEEVKAIVAQREQSTDVQAAANAAAWTMGTHMSDEQRTALVKALGVTMAGYPLMGAPDEIAEELGRLSDAGIDGVGLTWMNYEDGVPQFIGEIQPLLEASGVRRAAVGAPSVDRVPR